MVIKLKRTQIDFFSSIICGSVQAGLFNPIDRALYLSVVGRKHFLHKSNWTSPFHGFTQSVFHRIISGGFYFFLQATIRDMITPVLSSYNCSESTVNFYIGLLSGGINGAVLNQLATVKYHCWGKEGMRFSCAVKEMWRFGGYSPFFKGITDTINRDAVNGIFYELLRNILRKKLIRNSKDENVKTKIFFCNMSSAALATAASSPFNYARNIKFATHPGITPLTTFQCLKQLARETKQEVGSYQKINFLQQRLNIGWGTARVGVGMAIGQESFDFTRSMLQKYYLK